jgi:hypothetical protein
MKKPGRTTFVESIDVSKAKEKAVLALKTGLCAPRRGYERESLPGTSHGLDKSVIQETNYLTS